MLSREKTIEQYGREIVERAEAIHENFEPGAIIKTHFWKDLPDDEVIQYLIEAEYDIYCGGLLPTDKHYVR